MTHVKHLMRALVVAALCIGLLGCNTVGAEGDECDSNADCVTGKCFSFSGNKDMNCSGKRCVKQCSSEADCTLGWGGMCDDHDDTADFCLYQSWLTEICEPLP